MSKPLNRFVVTLERRTEQCHSAEVVVAAADEEEAVRLAEELAADLPEDKWQLESEEVQGLEAIDASEENA